MIPLDDKSNVFPDAFFTFSVSIAHFLSSLVFTGKINNTIFSGNNIEHICRKNEMVIIFQLNIKHTVRQFVNIYARRIHPFSVRTSKISIQAEFTFF